MPNPYLNMRLFFFLKKKVFKIPEGSLLPWWFILIGGILRPCTYIRWWWSHAGPIKVNFNTNTLSYYGYEYTEELLFKLRGDK